SSITRRDFLRATAGASAAAIGASAFSENIATSVKREKIRIGQIGTAHAHASGKMRSMRASADFEVAGVVEPDELRRAAAEKNSAYAGVKWMSEEELFSTPNLQAVAIETDVKNLVPTASRCIAAGKHVHLDK